METIFTKEQLDISIEKIKNFFIDIEKFDEDKSVEKELHLFDDVFIIFNFEVYASKYRYSENVDGWSERLISEGYAIFNSATICNDCGDLKLPSYQMKEIMKAIDELKFFV